MKLEDINNRLSDVPLFKELSNVELAPFINIAGSSYQLTTQFTNRELANMIGTSRETVSRTINHLKKKNYINQREDGLYLIDREALEQELFY